MPTRFMPRPRFAIMLCLVLAGVLPSTPQSPVTAIHVCTDIHYLAGSLHDSGPAFARMADSPDGRLVGLMDPVLDALGLQLKSEGAKTLVVSGDLTNNGEKQSHLDLASRLAALEAEGVQVFVIPGNHDLDNALARSYKGESVYRAPYASASDFASIYAEFGYRQAIGRDRASLSYVAEASPGLWLLMLDSTVHDRNVASGRSEVSGRLSPSTMDWVGVWLERAAQAGAIVLPVLHHSLLDHSAVIRDGFTLENNDTLVESFRGAGIRVSLSGHIHVQNIANSDSGRAAVFDIATSALSVYPHQYGILSFNLSTRSISYSTRRVDVEAWARASRSDDLRLLSFSTWSATAFGAASDRLGSRFMGSENGVDEADGRAMADTLRRLNLAFFAGRLGEEAAAIRSSTGFALFSSGRGGMIASYVLGILAEADGDHNRLQLGPGVIMPRSEFPSRRFEHRTR